MATDFKRVFESLRLAVAVTDTSGALTSANVAFAELAGREAGSLVGADFTSLFNEGDRKRVQQNLARVAGGKAATALFDAAMPGEDKPTWVSVSLQPALDPRDKPEGVVAVLHDIGAQREGDEALNLLTARQLALADVSPTGLLVETAPGDIELVNDVFCRALSLDSAPQSLSGLPVWTVLAKSPFIDKADITHARKRPAEAASIAITLADGRQAALEREPLVVEGAHGGAVWILREHGNAASAAEEGAAELAVIEKIGDELSIAFEGVSALAVRAQQMEFDEARSRACSASAPPPPLPWPPWASWWTSRASPGAWCSTKRPSRSGPRWRSSSHASRRPRRSAAAACA
jgi:PAS domain S-box